MGEDGVDAVAFLMSANVGEALRPIQKIASGGELSRIMLALKNVLAEQDSVMTMVFDEVDTAFRAGLLSAWRKSSPSSRAHGKCCA